MTKFEVGHSYYCRLVTSHDTMLVYKVVKRTAKYIVVERPGMSDPLKSLKVYVFDGTECVRPWGRYSMAPVLRADRVLGTGEPVCPYCGDPAGADGAAHSCS